MVTAYRVVIERDPAGGFVGTVPECPGVVSQGETISEALANTLEAFSGVVHLYVLAGRDVPYRTREANGVEDGKDD